MAYGKIFVVGCARSGTSLIHKLIASHSRVVGINETELLKKYHPRQRDVEEFTERLAESKKEKNIVSNHLKKKFGENLPLNPYEVLDEYCEAHRKYSRRSAYVGKSPIHSFFVKGLLQEIENSKVVFVVRDPRATIASRLNAWSTDRGKNLGLPRKARFYLNLSEIIFTYKNFNRWFMKSYDYDRIFFLNYEEVVTKPKEILKKLFEFLDLDFEPVHREIKPLDLRLEARGKLKEINSSYGTRKKKKISTKSLEKWKEELQSSEIQNIQECFSYFNFYMINKFYPDLKVNQYNKLRGFLVDKFSNLDRRFFIRKNVKAPKFRISCGPS